MVNNQLTQKYRWELKNRDRNDRNGEVGKKEYFIKLLGALDRKTTRANKERDSKKKK